MKKSILMVLTLIAFSLVLESQVLPTSMKVTVIDGLGNFVEGASVKLYTSKEDYLNSENAVAEGKTNSKGVVKFKKLEPIEYFIDARKDNNSNDGEGVQTQKLLEGRQNKVNTVIE